MGRIGSTWRAGSWVTSLESRPGPARPGRQRRADLSRSDDLQRAVRPGFSLGLNERRYTVFEMDIAGHRRPARITDAGMRLNWSRSRRAPISRATARCNRQGEAWRRFRDAALCMVEDAGRRCVPAPVLMRSARMRVGARGLRVPHVRSLKSAWSVPSNDLRPPREARAPRRQSCDRRAFSAVSKPREPRRSRRPTGCSRPACCPPMSARRVRVSSAARKCARLKTKPPLILACGMPLPSIPGPPD